MEPMIVGSDSKHRSALTDLALELAQRSASLRASLPTGIVEALAILVRTMNCYYSNLIEGHDTHPVDIERAMKGDYSNDKKKRNLQLEATAHIQVQAWIDAGGLTKEESTTTAGILEIHKRFCNLLPPDLLKIEDPKTGETAQVIPGALRNQDVRVGEHIAISPDAVPRFLNRFEEVYSVLGKSETILSTAAAHHRLLWIHPFLDGNGRVARLVSYTQLLKTLETGGIWSVARGLARNESMYKRHLTACDAPRQGALDGRGNLSEECLAQFTRFFLGICLDQVKFMESLVEPSSLKTRIFLWAEEEIRLDKMHPSTIKLLESILYRGELLRGDVPEIVGLGGRHSRRMIITPLLNRGVLSSPTERGPLHLAFPSALASRWMPGLFPPEKGIS
jgi:Fic family protein